jgi:Ca2+-binding RTX toxin-like protein
VNTLAVASNPIAALVPAGAAALGLIPAAQLAFYNGLPNAPDSDSIPNDKDDFVRSIFNGFLGPFGYDPIGLDNNLPIAAGKINATLSQGDYFVGHSFGWTDFDIAPATGELLVTTYGVPAYGAADLAANSASILALNPTVVSQFNVTPTSDSIIGTARRDDLHGTSAGDVILGAAGNDDIQGGDGDDYLDGGQGRDDISSGAGVDRIFGRDGNDTLRGEDGDDQLTGGAGDDVMTGGDGGDRFLFTPGFGNDRINGFDADPFGSQDFLDISAFEMADFQTRVAILDHGQDTLITIDANHDQTIRLLGVASSTNVTQADFIL